MNVPSDFENMVLAMAMRVLPEGWDVAADAPQTFDELCEHWEWVGRVRVWNGACDRTIFSEPRFNYAMRAWHDWCHLHLIQDFSAENERAVCEHQQVQVLTEYGDNLRTQSWCAILEADCIGQLEYKERHGRFPDNQEGFVLAYLVDRNAALAAQWE